MMANNSEQSKKSDVAIVRGEPKRPLSSGMIPAIGRVLFWVLAIMGSLIVFSNAIQWMMLGWLLYACLRVLRRMQSGMANQVTSIGTLVIGILASLIFLLVKQPGWNLATVAYLAGGLVVLLVLINSLARRKSPSLDPTEPADPFASPMKPLLAIVIMLALWGWFSIDRHYAANTHRQSQVDNRRAVICLGDSLTDGGYPELLDKRLVVSVEDFGRNGFTTDEAIETLLPEIESRNPLCVILELGGHDYKNGKPRSETKAKLEEIIKRVHAINSRVIIVEIPRGFITDPYYGLERELAAEYDLQLIPDTLIRRFIFWSPIVPPGSLVDRQYRLSKDGLHPNENGDELFAAYAEEALVKVFGSEILN